MADGMKLFFDGSSRPSPFGMALAVVIGGRSYLKCNLGLGTSMDAEWLALIEAMQLAHKLGLVDPVLLGDAAAVIDQANGAARCPPSCVDHMQVFQSLPRPLGRVRIRYLRRAQNLAGIALKMRHAR
jgi:ribonuclease HI